MKTGQYEGQDMDMYNKSKLKPPLPQSPELPQNKSKRMPGNHQSPTNEYNNKHVVLENSQGQDMEFADDLSNEDNGNVDMDADD